jgi:hypothetical protein
MSKEIDTLPGHGKRLGSAVLARFYIHCMQVLCRGYSFISTPTFISALPAVSIPSPCFFLLAAALTVHARKNQSGALSSPCIATLDPQHTQSVRLGVSQGRNAQQSDRQSDAST